MNLKLTGLALEPNNEPPVEAPPKENPPEVGAAAPNALLDPNIPPLLAVEAGFVLPKSPPAVPNAG